MARIPEDKRYFRIGEASRIIDVEPYVLRYWESEFPQVRPRRADSGQRTYIKSDLNLLLNIKKLLYEEKMTIEGARKRLKNMDAARDAADKSFLKDIKKELESILKTLS